MDKKILIFGTFHFPYGTAPASRVLNLCEGFVDNGYQVDVIAFSPPPNEESDVFGWKSLNENIRFCYLKEKQEHNHTILEKGGWFFSNFPLGLRLKKYIHKLVSTNTYECAFIYGRNYSVLFPSAKLISKLGIKIILDVVELPKTEVAKRYMFNPTHLDHKFGLQKLISVSNVVTPITLYLGNKISNKNQYLLPASISWKKIKFKKYSNQDSKINITYVGTLIDRDNPKIMLDFIKLLSEHLDVNLNIVGRFAQNKSGKKWIEYIKNDKILSNCCSLVGEVSEGKKQGVYLESDAFILPRRDHKDEIASFPTRLVEYIKESKLVIVSPIGDIKYYLSSKEVVFLNGELNNVVKRVITIYNQNEMYNNMIFQAFEKGKMVFNSKRHIKRLLDLL